LLRHAGNHSGMNATAILISTDEAADLLRTTRRRLLRLVRERRVPVVDLGDGEPRFSPDVLREWAKRQAEGAGDA
jgi:excisionase family DNA binding protein